MKLNLGIKKNIKAKVAADKTEKIVLFAVFYEEIVLCVYYRGQY